MGAKWSGTDQHRKKQPVPNEGHRDIVDGVPKHEEVLNDCFGRDMDRLTFHRCRVHRTVLMPMLMAHSARTNHRNWAQLTGCME
jgi:hypothetical protein